MLTWLLYIVALAVIVGVLTFVLGKVMGRGEVMPELVDNESLLKLNSKAVADRNLDAVRFDTVIRGYRQDQVDAVILQLTQELDEARAKREMPVAMQSAEQAEQITKT